MASRKRPTAPGNEEASTVLNLGELSDSQPLSVAEARLVMHSILDNRKKNNPNLLRETEVMNRTMDHVDFFARHRDQQSVEQVSLTLQGLRDLENFERSKLGECLLRRVWRGSVVRYGLAGWV